MRQRFSVAVLAACLGLLGVGVVAAGAAPGNAPTSLSGDFFDCSNGDSGTFVVNSGNSHPTTWNAAHLTFSGGGTGVFVPTGKTVTFDGVPEPPATKGSAQGSVSCSISASEDGLTLTGTVVGNIITNG
jgi:hypothetical protein